MTWFVRLELPRAVLQSFSTAVDQEDPEAGGVSVLFKNEGRLYAKAVPQMPG